MRLAGSGEELCRPTWLRLLAMLATTAGPTSMGWRRRAGLAGAGDSRAGLRAEVSAISGTGPCPRLTGT